MTDFVRIPAKIFAENASPVGNDPQIGKFGNAKQGIYTGVSDVQEIQNSEAWSQGWTSAVVSAMNFPPLPEMNGVLKVLSYQICYLLQKGIPQWDADTIYYKNDYVNYNGKLYYSDIDNNTFEPETPGAGNSWLSGTSDVAIATNDTNGISRPDGETIKIDSDGVLRVTNSGLELGDIGLALYVDETKGLRRKLNGSIVDINENTQGFLNFLKSVQSTTPELFTTESNWQSQARNNVDGCVYQFVLNEDAGTIRLPKYPEYIEITDSNMAVIGNGTAVGITNGTENAGMTQIGYNGYELSANMDLYGSGVGEVDDSVTKMSPTYTAIGITTNPSYSGMKVADSDITKLKMQYFIQIATGGSTDVTIDNQIDINTPFSLFEPKYITHLLYNASWLLSNGNYYSGNTYPTAFQALEVEANAQVAEGQRVLLPSGQYYTKQGLSVVNSDSGVFTDYDFVIKDNTFRLPLATELYDTTRYLIQSGSNNGVNYRIYSDGFCEQWGVVSNNANQKVTVNLYRSYNSSNYEILYSMYETNNEDVWGYGLRVYEPSPSSFQLYMNGSTSGMISWRTQGYIHNSQASSEDINLYFYVGETIQNANLIDAGRVMEEINNFVPVQCVIETYINGTSGYRIWSDGYCEQWGYMAVPSSDSNITISFLKQYKDTNYFIFRQPRVTKIDFNVIYGFGFIADTMTTSKIDMKCTNSSYVDGFYWYVKGYLPEGTY